MHDTSRFMDRACSFEDLSSPLFSRKSSVQPDEQSRLVTPDMICMYPMSAGGPPGDTSQMNGETPFRSGETTLITEQKPLSCHEFKIRGPNTSNEAQKLSVRRQYGQKPLTREWENRDILKSQQPCSKSSIKIHRNRSVHYLQPQINNILFTKV